LGRIPNSMGQQQKTYQWDGWEEYIWVDLKMYILDGISEVLCLISMDGLKTHLLYFRVELMCRNKWYCHFNNLF
jgi:hypothetical protein